MYLNFQICGLENVSKKETIKIKLANKNKQTENNSAGTTHVS